MIPDLVKVTEIFLVPSSFLVAALGTADSNPHRACISLLGLIVSVLWMICSRDAYAEIGTTQAEALSPTMARRASILVGLSVVFVVGWFGSTVVHAMLWNKPL